MFIVFFSPFASGVQAVLASHAAAHCNASPPRAHSTGASAHRFGGLCDEFFRAHIRLPRADQTREVARHRAGFDQFNARALEQRSEPPDLGRAVEAAALRESTGPCDDRR
jgi:hypothetical protein